MAEHFYELSARTLQGKDISMQEWKGKVIIVVNTASKCGFTPQYAGLEKLYQDYKDRGLVVLGFPCNQFAGQEPGEKESIEKTCYVNYGVSFPMFEKVEVNGKDAHPVFKFLKASLPQLLGSRIKWNFTKFVIDQTGKPVKRFSPAYAPEKMVPFIEQLLGRER